MKQRKRIYYNAQQRAVIWDRYQQGDSLHDIAKIFDRMHSSIQGLLARTGGIRPPDKTRAGLHLTSQEREEISRSLSSQLSIREIEPTIAGSISSVLLNSSANHIRGAAARCSRVKVPRNAATSIADRITCSYITHP